jgi:phosphate transport system permease protein
MRFDRLGRRKLFSHGMTVLTGLSVVVILVPLVAVIYQATLLGGSAISLGFFTQVPPYPCTPRTGVTCASGGIGPAIQGTLILIGLASLVAIPIGVTAAIYIVEFGRQRPIAQVISSAADVMSGVPSIVAGVFIYALFVAYDPTIVFSAISGSLALSFLMIPIVTRTSEEALRTVPNSVREAALALGISKWKISLRIVLAATLPGVLTGALLAVARAAGEAAPLLLTAFGNPRFFQGLNNPIDAMPLLIFQFATSPYRNWQALAWGAALVLILLVLLLSVISRFVLSRIERRMRGG